VGLLLNNENFAGQPFNPLKEAALLFAPLGPQNAVQTYRSEGPGRQPPGSGWAASASASTRTGRRENRRKFVIDEMVGQGYSHAEINQALHELGYEPVAP
jgi:hypothetical protein